VTDFEKNFRLFLHIFLVIIILTTLIFFGPLPAILDHSSNKVLPHQPYPFSDKASVLHAKLNVADLHADSLLWRRDPAKRHGYGLVDLPRLIDGNSALQVFDIVTKVPVGQNYEGNPSDSDIIGLLALANLWPQDTWGSLKARALHQASRLEALAADSRGLLKFVKTSRDLKAVMAEREGGAYTVAAILGLEGAHALDKDVANLDDLEAAGIRIYGLTHFFDNFIAGSAHGIEKGGLTDDGRRLVRELEKRHLIIDLAHLAPAAIDDVLVMATRPVIVSHTGVKGTCDGTRNLTDRHIDRIAAGGGLIGIGMWSTATCGNDLSSTVKAMKYVAERVGVQHVALGSDWDGAIEGFIDVSETGAITQMLIDQGFSDADITLIMGGNAIRFMLENLPK
jgi:membrane dipeptidase